jgi:hypothetical protein
MFPLTVVPVIVPPVIATALAFWDDIVPKELTAVVTKAVVAIWVVFVPAVAVGANGVPVKVGLAAKTMLPEPVTFCPKAVATPVPKDVTPVPPEPAGSGLANVTA